MFFTEQEPCSNCICLINMLLYIYHTQPLDPLHREDIAKFIREQIKETKGE